MNKLKSFFNHCIAIGLFQKKFEQRDWEHTFLKKTLEIFRFVNLPLEIPDKTNLHPWKFQKIVLHPLEFPRPKTKPMEIPHDFFFDQLSGNSTSFFIDPCIIISTLYFFNTPGNFVSFLTPVWIFFWNSPF